MTLRRRLVLAVGVVAVIVCGSIAALLVILRASLRDELDRQLLAATRDLVECSSQLPEDAAPGTPTELDDQFIGDGIVSGGACGRTGPPSGSEPPPRLAPEVVEAHATEQSDRMEPFDASVNDQHYRAAAVRVAGGRFLVAALPTDHIDATFRRVAVGSAVVGGALLAAMGLLAWWVERLGLRPIRRVAAAADAIASGETSRRVDPPPEGTEAGNLARAFNVMVDDRQAAEDRLRRFVTDASHELRTPLTTVAGVHELFRSGSLTGPDLDEAMRRAGSEASRMTSLVEDLLLLTQLDHGRPLADDEVDLAGLLADAVVDVGLVQPSRPVTVELDAGEAVVRGDEARLRQVIGNLVTNALTHTSPTTALHLAIRPDDRDYVLEVRDAGPGLTAEQAAQVFDRFYRVAPGRSRREGGSGLGLSIVRSIVDAHGGQVSVTAAPGEGCTFRVRLPGNFQEP
jgi:two-component system OmpR family sensor kinase